MVPTLATMSIVDNGLDGDHLSARAYGARGIALGGHGPGLPVDVPPPLNEIERRPAPPMPFAASFRRSW